MSTPLDASGTTGPRPHPPASPPPPPLGGGLASGVYVGTVRHRRARPKRHELTAPLFMMYLDLEELPRVFAGRWLWSVGRRNLVSFRREDYLAGAADLRTAVLDRVESALGRRPAGPVRMLTHLRWAGYVFNPVTFYYCFGEGEGLEAVAAEITNTPWKERHTYVVDGRGAGDRAVHAEFAKAFHVSPFMPMEQRYRWHFRMPGERIVVHMENLDGEGRIFDASLSLRRREIGGGTLAWALVRYPLMPLRVAASIYWNAVRLRLRGVGFHSHPKWRNPGEGGERTRGDA